MEKKSYEIPTLTEYGTMTEITQNIKDHHEHKGWAGVITNTTTRFL
jgi:hypothetical protein